MIDGKKADLAIPICSLAAATWRSASAVCQLRLQSHVHTAHVLCQHRSIAPGRSPAEFRPAQHRRPMQLQLFFFYGSINRLTKADMPRGSIRRRSSRSDAHCGTQNTCAREPQRPVLA